MQNLYLGKFYSTSGGEGGGGGGGGMDLIKIGQKGGIKFYF